MRPLRWQEWTGRLLAVECLIVAASTYFLSGEPGKLTVLSLYIQMLPYLPLALVAGSEADAVYHKVGLFLSIVPNLLAFLLIAAPIFLVLRRRAPKALLIATIAWLAIYMLLLFVMFPVTNLDL